MSCTTNGNRVASTASQGSGVIGQASRYLNSLGSWSTYRDLNSVEELPERLAEVTGAYFGLKGLAQGRPRPAGLMGAVIGVQALEQATGGVATTGMRLYARGKPVANYRGVLIRKSPFTPKAGRVLDRLTGGRVLEANGYYFFEKGKSWHAASTTMQVGDTAKTLTRVRSLSLPAREFYFDRPVTVKGDREPKEGEKSIPIQRVIDTIKGDEEPDAVPGFIGSINELEGLSPALKNAKQALFAANWLLMDQGDREGGSDYVDYEGLVKGRPAGSSSSGGGVYEMARQAVGGSTGTRWPSTRSGQSARRTGPARTVPIRRATEAPAPTPQPYGTNLFRSGPQSQKGFDPGRLKDRIRIDGRDYPLAVTRVVRSPLTGVEKAEAMYYDRKLDKWREVTEEEEKVRLAKAVRDGQLSVVDLGQ